MSAPRVKLLESAHAELRAAAEHYLKVANPKVAGALLDKLEDTLALIRGNPEIGRPVSTPAKNLRLLAIKHFPFSVIYRSGVDEIVVIAIAHHRRRPGYWQSRG